MPFIPSSGLNTSGPGGVRIDAEAVARLLRSEQGPVMRDMARRAQKVEDGARAQVGYSTDKPSGPEGGEHLRDTIVKRWAEDSQGPMLLVGSSHSRARLHHDGTDPHEIVPVNAKVLAFPVAGGMVFAARVSHPGTDPNRYLTDNLKLAAQ